MKTLTLSKSGAFKNLKKFFKKKNETFVTNLTSDNQTDDDVSLADCAELSR